ncbi:MAG: polysaccharide biosynthesis protein, partial [Hominilimicola sp.]
MNIYYHKRVGLDMFFFWREIFKFIPSLILPVTTVILIHHFVWADVFSIIVSAVIFTIVYGFSILTLGLNKSERDYITKRTA